MRVPPSFALAFLPVHSTAIELERIAGQRLLTTVCQPRGWLFDGRVKSEQSALSKLELGPVQALAKMQDLYAATVVVPTRNEVAEAVAAIRESLPETRVQKRRRGDPETFVYDDVHLLARLGDTAPGLNEGIRKSVFEIQVRTGLQYAWWRATHDVVYKGGERSWRLKRMASQVRASLELLDAALANLRDAAELLEAEDDAEEQSLGRVLAWLDTWPAERRPRDGLRFFEAVQTVCRAAGIGLDEIEQMLNAPLGKALISDENITPFQVVLGAVITERGSQVVDQLPERRFVLLTDEFARACPEAAHVAQQRRVRL